MMISHPLSDLLALNRFKSIPFPPGYPGDVRTFYSPVDDLHGALKYLIDSAQQEIVLAMYGLDDDELASSIKAKMAQPNIRVQLTLDSSQAGGMHERKLLQAAEFPNNSLAIGRSERGAIMHMKMLVIDGTVLATGSTNWSAGGEHLQDNELTISLHPARAAEAKLRISAVHQHMLAAAQGGAK